jgi:hypothetical protein
MRWSFSERDGRLGLRITSEKKPGRARAWVARSPTRDFRDAHWEAHPMKRRGDAYVFELEMPREGYAAVFGEAQYEPWSGASYWFSTTVRIVGGDHWRAGSLSVQPRSAWPRTQADRAHP